MVAVAVGTLNRRACQGLDVSLECLLSLPSSSQKGLQTSELTREHHCVQSERGLS
jgi:hypothetical protein